MSHQTERQLNLIEGHTQVDTLEQLQARLFHLAYLAEELPRVAQDRDAGGWISGRFSRIVPEGIASVKAIRSAAVSRLLEAKKAAAKSVLAGRAEDRKSVV